MEETINFKKLRLDRKFRFGADRGKPGNGMFKKIMKKKSNRTKPFSSDRLAGRGIHTNAMSGLYVERVDVPDDATGVVNPEYMVSFRKKPLIGKTFLGQTVKYTEDFSRTTGKPILDKLEDINGNMTHISREIQSLKKKKEEDDDPILISQYMAQIEAYEKEHAKLFSDAKEVHKTIAKHNLFQHQTAYPKVKLSRPFRLHVTNVVEYNKKDGFFVCICKPL